MTVKELTDKMDLDEFCDWLVYYNLEPWGSKIEGYRSASISAITANASLAASGSKKRPYKLEDFLIGVKEVKATYNNEDERVRSIRNTLMAMATRSKRRKK